MTALDVEIGLLRDYGVAARTVQLLGSWRSLDQMANTSAWTSRTGQMGGPHTGTKTETGAKGVDAEKHS